MRRALVVGTNYQANRMRLKFAESDATKFKKFLEQRYPDIQVVFLIGPDATKDQIMQSFRLLVNSTKSGDSLFFYYSGHGIQIKDTSGDEISGKDDAIIGYNAKNFYDSNALIIDDDLLEIISELPSGSMFRAVIDACHSGTLFDLNDTISMTESDGKMIAVDYPNQRNPKSISVDGLVLSSSKDSQSSYEDSQGGIFTRQLLNLDVNKSSLQLLAMLTQILKYTQTPMLSSTSTNFSTLFFPV